jgi:RNA polymerase sigma-70 factor (ECF subfamily)
MPPPGPLDRLTDEELMERAARFDSAALAELYDRHSPVALALARRMLGPTRAEDAVQEAFTSIWRNAATYDPERGFVRTWLLRIVRYRSIDILRSIAVEDRRALDAEHEHERAEPQDPPSGALIRRDRATEIREALAALPAEQRQVVELAYFGGWTQVEIAAQLDLPVGTVKGRARLALSKLRAQLDPSMDTAE